MRFTVSKQLSANDLGLTGTHQAGIHIPKQRPVLSFFPVLDESVLNPSCQVNLYLPDRDETVVCRFVHYNNKLVEHGTRDEYRLTRTNALLRALDARVGDLLELTRQPNGDIVASVSHASDTQGPENESEIVTQLRGGWRLHNR